MRGDGGAAGTDILSKGGGVMKCMLKFIP